MSSSIEAHELEKLTRELDEASRELTKKQGESIRLKREVDEARHELAEFDRMKSQMHILEKMKLEQPQKEAALHHLEAEIHTLTEEAGKRRRAMDDLRHTLERLERK